MDGITYLSLFSECKKNGQKLAKISQEKLKSLKGKYNAFLTTLTKAEPAPSVVEKKADIAVDPVVSQNVTPRENIVLETPVKADNYSEVLANFMITVYGNTFNEKPLSGARKIRVNSKVKKHVKGLDKKYGKAQLVDIVVTTLPPEVKMQEVANNFNEELPVSKKISSPVNNDILSGIKVEQPMANEMSRLDNTLKGTYSSPSVDDYLQKEMPNQEDGIIAQLTGDVASLKEEAKKRTLILEKLEAQYNTIKEQKAKRIEELEEQKLSYTATLDGLTEKIKLLQESIAREEQAMSSFSK